MFVIVVGVSGCGKSTVGKLLAERLDCPFYDGDDFHPAANIAKMSQGIHLNDADRAG
jgi:carbohydrate kinase (thermoresistant glucokinase family)